MFCLKFFGGCLSLGFLFRTRVSGAQLSRLDHVKPTYTSLLLCTAARVAEHYGLIFYVNYSEICNTYRVVPIFFVRKHWNGIY